MTVKYFDRPIGSFGKATKNREDGSIDLHY